MSFEGRDHFTDKLFRKKLKDLDVGNQGHLWEGISKALDEEKRSGRFIYFPWMLKTLVGLSLISFSLLAAYKIGYQHSMKEKSLQTPPLPEWEQRNLENEDNTSAGLISKIVNQDQSIDVRSGINRGQNNSIVLSEEQKESGEELKEELVPKPNQPRWSLLVAGTGEAVKKVMQGNQGKSDSGLPLKGVIDGSNAGIATSDFIEEQEVSGGKMLVDANQKEINSGLQSLSLLPSSKELTLLNGSNKNDLRIHIKDDPCNMIQRYVKRDKIYLDFYYAPEISKRSIEAVYPESDSYADKRNMEERFIKAFSAGIRGSYVFRNGLALRTGFNYSEIKERFDFFAGTQIITIIKRDDKNNPIDTVQEEVPIIENIYNRYRFYDIPLVAGYEVDLADFLLSVNGGVAINLMTSRSGTIYNLDKKSKLDLSSNSVEGKNYFRNNVGMSLVGSFGLNYKLNRGLMLLAEPSVRYYLGSVTTDAYPLKQKYLQFGLIAGIRYQFVR